MIYKYIIFCLGAALIQSAWQKQADPRATSKIQESETPWLFSTFASSIVLLILGIGSLAGEIILGVTLIAWWAGAFFWIPALIVANLIVQTRNPMIPFFAGITLIITSLYLIYF